MKMPTLENIAQQIAENISLLGLIISNAEPDSETQCSLLCLSRSLISVHDDTQECINWVAKQDNPQSPAQNTQKVVTETQLYSWAADIGNCNNAITVAIDNLPPEMKEIGMLALVFEKLNELQETICNTADKLEN